MGNDSSGSVSGATRWTSVEAEGSWTLTLDNDVERTIHLEATTSTLTQPFDVCGVTLDGTALSEDDWSYDEATGVLDATYTTTSGIVTVTGC
jgi:hypothetical protein